MEMAEKEYNINKNNASDYGKIGGKKSGEVRRKKRDMKNAMKLLLDLGVASPKTQAQMKALGISERDMTNQMAILLAMMNSAMKGDIKAAEFIRDTAGETINNSAIDLKADTKLNIKVDYGNE